MVIISQKSRPCYKYISVKIIHNFIQVNTKQTTERTELEKAKGFSGKAKRMIIMMVKLKEKDDLVYKRKNCGIH